MKMSMKIILYLGFVTVCLAARKNITKDSIPNDSSAKENYLTLYMLNKINERFVGSVIKIDDILKKLENIDNRINKLELQILENYYKTQYRASNKTELTYENKSKINLQINSATCTDKALYLEDIKTLMVNLFDEFTKNLSSQCLNIQTEKPILIHQRTGLITEAPEVSRELKSLPHDCREVQKIYGNVSGVYKIRPPTKQEPLLVYCDQEVDGGGWTVFQNRFNGSTDFYRNWQEYKNGFGSPHDEYWLGLEDIFKLTQYKKNELYISLQGYEDNSTYAFYGNFSLGPESTNYKLTSLGEYKGTAGNSFYSSEFQEFSTYDNSAGFKNCAMRFHGAWWFPKEQQCFVSHLNGKYWNADEIEYGKGIHWSTYRGLYNSLKSTRMMIRPKSK